MSENDQNNHLDKDEGDGASQGAQGGARKGKKGKGKGKKEERGAVATPQALSPDQQEKLKKAMELLSMQNAQQGM